MNKSLKKLDLKLLKGPVDLYFHRETEQTIQEIIQYVKQHWLYRANTWFYALGAALALTASTLILLDIEIFSQNTVFSNAVIINGVCLFSYLTVYLLLQVVYSFTGHLFDILNVLKPLKSHPEWCHDCLKFMTLPAAAAYRDQVLEQGRELLILDYYAIQRIGERKLRRQEQRDIELACKKLHKLA